MHVTVPLWMITRSNTLVYPVHVFVLFCFTVLYCEWIFMCVLCCLMFVDMFHIQMQLMQRLDQLNEYVCIYWKWLHYVCENEVYLLVVDVTEFFECVSEQWLVIGIKTNMWTHSSEQRLLWESYSCSAGQDITHILWNLQVHYCGHKGPLLDHILSKLYLFRILAP